MPTSLPPLLIAASAAIALCFGLIHLVYTFSGRKLLPRDPDLQARMQEVSPVLTRQTTMWKIWIGFNASHSYGAIFFGAVYGYLSLAHGGFLFRSPFLLVLGLTLLAGYAFLAKRYWFRAPLQAFLLATALYLLALVIHWFAGA